MNDQPRLSGYLEHIVEAVRRIEEYTADITVVTFLDNPMIQDAVIRNIEIIGEASRNIQRRHPEFVSRHDEVPWEDAYWMRNRLTHGYFAIDMEIVWKAVERDIPEMGYQVKLLLAQLDD